MAALQAQHEAVAPTAGTLKYRPFGIVGHPDDDQSVAVYVVRYIGRRFDVRNMFDPRRCYAEPTPDVY